MQKGLVHRLQSRSAFVACGHGACDGKFGFAICRQCGRVVEIPLSDDDQAALLALVPEEILARAGDARISPALARRAARAWRAKGSDRCKEGRPPSRDLAWPLRRERRRRGHRARRAVLAAMEHSRQLQCSSVWASRYCVSPCRRASPSVGLLSSCFGSAITWVLGMSARPLPSACTISRLAMIARILARAPCHRRGESGRAARACRA